MSDERPATYFESTDDWRGWLEEKHESKTELWVGFWKGHGWIDGLRQKVDESARRELPKEYVARLEADPAALSFWQSTRPSYRKVVTHWVLTAGRSRGRITHLRVRHSEAGRSSGILDGCKQ